LGEGIANQEGLISLRDTVGARLAISLSTVPLNNLVIPQMHHNTLLRVVNLRKEVWE